MPRALSAILVLVTGLLSGCAGPYGPPVDSSSTVSESPTSNPSASRDPRLAEVSARLRQYGIDCAYENTHDTRDSFAIDPVRPNVLYVGVEGEGVFKSVDGGATWNRSSAGILAYPDQSRPDHRCYPDMARIVIDRSDHLRVLLAPADVSTGYPDWPYAETAGVWESLDEGASWHQIARGDINAAGTGALAIDPQEPSTIYFGVNSDGPTFREAPTSQTLNTKGPLYKTTDGGATWTEAETGMLPGLQVTGIFVHSEDPQEVLIFTQSHDHLYHDDGTITEVFLHEQFGPMRSSDGGRTWTALSDHLPEPYRAVFDGDATPDLGRLIVRTFVFGPEFPNPPEQRSYYSRDGGETFHQTPMYLHVARFDPHDATGMHLLGFSPFYAGSDLLESLDGGATWQPVGEPAGVGSQNVRVSNMVWSPSDAQTIYATGTQAHVWRSTDGARTWQTLMDLDTMPD